MFSKIQVNSLKYKTKDLPSKATKEYCLPALTAGIENQGLNNYVPYDGATVLKNVVSISANGANTGATFYQSREFTVLQDAYAIQWIYNDYSLTDNQYLFITGCIAKTVYGNYEWTNKAGWERIKKNTISLPETNDGQIDFDFMESFVAELEAERVAELETYLKVSGLENYELSKEEEKLIEEISNIEFKDFDITDIFDIYNTHNILSRDIVEGSGMIPYLCASSENNSISSYIAYQESFKEKGNCVFIGGKTFVVTYQKDDFFSNDSHNLALYLKGSNPNRLNQLYLVTCIYKSLAHKYSWRDSVSKTKIKKDKLFLPTINGKPDYELMERIIKTVQKLVVKDVVQYADKKITATKNIVSNS